MYGACQILNLWCEITVFSLDEKADITYLFQRISKRAKRSKDKIMNNPLQIPNEQGAARASSVSLATKRQKFHFNPLPLYTSSRPKRSQSSRQIRLWGKRTNAGLSEHKVQLLPTGPQLPPSNFDGNRRKTYSFKRPWIWLTPPDFHIFRRHWNKRYTPTNHHYLSHPAKPFS